MRFRILFILFLLLIFSCQQQSEIPVSKPQKFNQKEYAQYLTAARDSIEKNLKINKTQTQKTQSKQSQNDTDKQEIPKEPVVKKPVARPMADTVKFVIDYGKSKIDTSKLALQEVVFEFDSDYATRLILKVIPEDSLANLGISQIISPSGKTGGPFGREVEYPIDEKGIYKVSVSEDLTDERPYSGRFLFDLRLSWKRN